MSRSLGVAGTGPRSRSDGRSGPRPRRAARPSRGSRRAPLVDPLDLGAASRTPRPRAGPRNAPARRSAGRGSRRSHSRRPTRAPTVRRRSSRRCGPGRPRRPARDVDREVLRRIGVDEGDGGVQVRGERDPAVDRQRAGEDGAALQTRKQGGDLALDRVGELRARRHEDRRRVGAVLRLGDEVGGDEDADRRSRRRGPCPRTGRPGGRCRRGPRPRASRR